MELIRTAGILIGVLNLVFVLLGDDEKTISRHGTLAICSLLIAYHGG